MPNKIENTTAEWKLCEGNADYYSCSNCGYVSHYDDDILQTDYCPKCGKKMRNGKSYWEEVRMTYADVLNKIMTEKQFENTRFVSVNRFFYKYAKKWYESVPIKDVVYFFHCEVLDFCNCGVPKYTQSAICKILTIQNDNSLSYEDKKVQYKKIDWIRH